MLHILVGAFGGAIISTAVATVIATVQGRRPTWKELTAAAVGGALGGGITAATLGLGSAAAVSTTQGVIAFGGGGAIAAGSSQATDNVLHHKAIQDDVLEASLVGGLSGVATFGASKALQPALRKVAPSLQKSLSPLTRRFARANQVNETVLRGRPGLTGASNGSRSNSRGLVGALRNLAGQKKAPSINKEVPETRSSLSGGKRSSASRPSPARPRDGINLSLGESPRLLPASKQRLFKGDQANIHFKKHFAEISEAFGRRSYGIMDYLDDANWVIQEGQWLPELNAYVKLIGGQGSAKYAFVGLDRSTGKLTTFHIKTAKELARKAPSLELEMLPSGFRRGLIPPDHPVIPRN